MSLKARLSLLSPGQSSLGARIVRAGGWTMLQIGAGHALRLASNLIMTRLLVPEAFGMMALALLVVTGLALLTDIGIAQSIVREKDGAEPRFLHAAWVVKIKRGVLIAIGVVAVAVLIGIIGPRLAAPGTVYADPVMPWLIAMAAFSPLIGGFESTVKELAARRLHYSYFTLVTLLSQVLSIGAMILFAQFSPTVWALMAGTLVGKAAMVAASHAIYPGPKMRFAPDPEVEARIWRFGKWLLGSSAFFFFGKNADRMILASLLSATSFGLYVIAQIWIEAAKLVIQQISTRVGFSAISEVLRTRPDEVPRLYRRFQIVIDAMCLAAFAVMCFGGKLLIEFLYTAEYAEAGNYVAILSLSLLLVRFETFRNLIMSGGNSRAMMVISIINAVTMIVSVPLAYNLFGLKGVLLAVALNAAFNTPYTLWLCRPILGDRVLLFDAFWLLAALAIAIPVYVTS